MNQNLATAGDHTPLTRGQWLVLITAVLGWMFDGVQMGLFPIAARPALIDLMGFASDAGSKVDPHAMEQAVGPFYSWLVAMFLLGAAAGGWAFGWLGDKIGRVKAMAMSIAVYSLFTGLCVFATQPWHLAACRFLCALGMGGEWGLGVALVMETWPAKYRPILAGTIGAAANVGFLLISIPAIFFPVTPEHWQWIMGVGAIPGVLALFVIFFVPESKKWQESVQKGQKTNPLREVFSSRLAGKTIVAILLASVCLIGTWGAVSGYIPLWVDQMVGKANPYAKGMVQMVLGVGTIVGCFVGPMLARWLNRRTSYFLLCIVSLASCQYLFRVLDTYNLWFVVVAGMTGLFTAAFYGWFPLYLPELFPTRVRSTGQGIAFNSGRVFAAAGVLTWGQLFPHVFHGQYPVACATITLVYVAGMVIIWFAPETKGKPLPD